MARTETDHLVAMANDIAANFSFQPNADEQIADHINRFWAPRMRRLLLEYAARDDAGLSAVLMAALEKLKQA